MPNPSPSSAVRVDKVDFAYADRLVLKHVSLEVASGATVGLVGPNGGGKTTLIKLIVGLLRATRGEISIGGLDPTTAARQGGIFGYLPQRVQLNATMPLSTAQFISLCIRVQLDSARRDYLLEATGIRDLADLPVGELSGGQLQRLLIARALADSPRVLLLDEPTTGIDAESRQQFVRLLQRLRNELSLTIILASHDLQTVHELCDEIACLNLSLHTHTRGLRSAAAPEGACNVQPPVHG